jgi:hypothetical protein
MFLVEKICIESVFSGKNLYRGGFYWQKFVLRSFFVEKICIEAVFSGKNLY